MVLLLMASRSTGVAAVDDKVAKIPAVQPILTNEKKKSYVPIKSAVVYADWSVHSVLPVVL